MQVLFEVFVFFHKRIRFRGQGVDQAHRSDDAPIPIFYRHGYKPKLLKPQHQFALLRIVLLQNVFEHVQRGCPDGDQQRSRLITRENGCYTFPSDPPRMM